MITTMLPLLQELSRRLKESATDTSSTRIGYGCASIKKVVSMYKWFWSKIKGTLTISAGVQEYNLTTSFTDYDSFKGIDTVWIDGKKYEPITYDRKADYTQPTEQKVYLTPDNKTIGFIKTLDGTEVIDIWYFAQFTDVLATGTAFNISIPDSMLAAIALYMKHLVHEGKRQRYDSRNALIDFKEEIDTQRPMAASKKIKDLPKSVSNPFVYNRVKRVYATH